MLKGSASRKGEPRESRGGGAEHCPALYLSKKGVVKMTRKEIFAERLETTGDFWRVCQELVNDGWTFSDFEDAGVVQDLYGFTDSTFEENVEYLRNMLLAPRHLIIHG